MSDVLPVERRPDGTLPAFADIGGYPLLYLTAHGNVLCAGCATRNLDSGDDDPVRAAGVHWEGEPEVCQECNTPIPSAYGNPTDTTTTGGTDHVR